jgi:DNA-binding transcriptional MerR regulator
MGEKVAESGLYGIGEAAARTGASERALRYYQELGLLTPCARTPGGMRRYSEADLARVARIRELQSLLGLNLDEIAVVMRSDDRMSEIKAAYQGTKAGTAERAALLEESLELQEHLLQLVQAKKAALEDFLSDLEGRIARIEELGER